MPRAFSGKGDKGDTGLWGGRRVPKNDSLIMAVGEIDEANATIGLAASLNKDEKIAETLEYVQNALFTVGAEISSSTSPKTPPIQTITEMHIKKIEAYIELFDRQLPDLRAFILPSGSSAVASLHCARAVIRRAERALVAASGRALLNERGAKLNSNPALIQFLNRTSSLLFVMARWLNQKEGGQEKHPTY